MRIIIICFLAYFIFLFSSLVDEQYDFVLSLVENPSVWDVVGNRIWILIVPTFITLAFWKKQLFGWILMVGINVLVLLSNAMNMFKLRRIFTMPDFSYLYRLQQICEPIIGLTVSITILYFIYKPSLQDVFGASRSQFWIVVGIMIVLILGRFVV